MTADEPPGELIGTGRSADVFAVGSGRVLRRFRTPWDVQAEAELMIFLRQAGFPVPVVYDASGADLVMERLDGRDMLADLGRRPWLVRRHARTLAGLHNQLHAIPAPAGLNPGFGPGGQVLHLDFHPANVMLTSGGPVVIDWTNARAGPAGADVAMAYLIMGSSEVDQVPAPVRPLMKSFRTALIRQFLSSVRDDPGPYIAAVVSERVKDPNVRPSEARWLLRMAERQSG
jgi:aminoglycoside phosphotransferase (APT) family kinase protein